MKFYVLQVIRFIFYKLAQSSKRLRSISRWTALLVLCTLMFVDVAPAQAGKVATKSNVEIENTSSTLLQIETNAKELNKQVQSSIELQEKRLGDIWGVVNILGYVAGLLGCLITAIVVFFSFKSATAAKVEARQGIEEWLRNNGMELLKEEIKRALAPPLEKALTEIKDAATPILVQLDAELQKTTRISEVNSQQQGGSEAKDIEVSGFVEVSQPIAEEANPIAATGTEPRYYVQPKHRSHQLRSTLREALLMYEETRKAEAIAKIEAMIEELSDSDDERDQVMLIEAKCELARLYSELDQTDNANALLTKTIEQYESTTSPEIAIALFQAYFQRARELEADQRYDEAISLHQRAMALVEKFHISPATGSGFSIKTLNAIGRSQFEKGAYAEVIATDAKLVEVCKGLPSFPPKGIPAIFFRSSRIRASKALSMMKKFAEAKELLRGYISSLESADAGSLSLIGVDSAMMALAAVSEDEGRLDEALVMLGAILNRMSQRETDGRPHSTLVQALLRKATILSALSLSAEELKVYDEIIHVVSYGPDVGAHLLNYRVTAQVNKAIALSKLGKSKEALEIADAVIVEFRSRSDREIVEQVAKAARLKALLER